MLSRCLLSTFLVTEPLNNCPWCPCITGGNCKISCSIPCDIPIGITALGLLVQVDTQYSLEHQLVVIDCLDDPDDTLKRKVTMSCLSLSCYTCVNVILHVLYVTLSTSDQWGAPRLHFVSSPATRRA